MRLQDLPPGLVRAGSSPIPIYVPAPRRPRRWGRRIVVRAGAAAVVLMALAGGIGDQSALATLRDVPSWQPALKAANPGVALSPHMTTLAGPARLNIPDEVVAEAGKKTDRLPSPALVSPGANPLIDFAFRLGPDDRIRTTVHSVPGGGSSALASPPPVPRTAPAVSAPSALSAYAEDRVTIETPFELLLQGAEARATLPQGLSGEGRDHWWSDRPLPEDITSKRQIKCIAEAIYFEARSEPDDGQAAVAQVVINRVKNPAYPDDACSVVYQNRKWYNRCQFTFACDRRKDLVTDKAAWAKAERIAKQYATGEMWLRSVGAATHYHAKRVHPTWANLMRQVRVIHNHIFYITRGGGWT